MSGLINAKNLLSLLRTAEKTELGRKIMELHKTPDATVLPRDLSGLSRRTDPPAWLEGERTQTQYYGLPWGGEAAGDRTTATVPGILQNRKDPQNPNISKYFPPHVIGEMQRRPGAPITIYDTLNLGAVRGRGRYFYAPAYHDDLMAGRRNVAVALTDQNKARRTANMLHSYLREGTGEHIILSPEAQGLKGLAADAFAKVPLQRQIGILAGREFANVERDVANSNLRQGLEQAIPGIKATPDEFRRGAALLHKDSSPDGPITTGESALRRAAIYRHILEGGNVDAINPELTRGLFMSKGGRVRRGGLEQCSCNGYGYE